MADKQLYVIDDFTGSMNSEADASDLQPNESLLLENIYPSGQGKLSLDRARCTVAPDGVASAITTFTAAEGVYAFKDTMQDIVVIASQNDYVHVLYSTAALTGSTPVLIDKVLIHEYTSQLPDVTKAHFVTYNGITRMGCDSFEFPPVTIMNFGRHNGLTSGTYWTNRQRFLSNNYKVGATDAIHGIAIFTDDTSSPVEDTTPPYKYLKRGCGVYPPRIGKVDDAGAGDGGVFTYGNHGLGVYCRESSGAGTGCLYEAGDEVWFGFSLEYDFTQESPMAVLGDALNPTLTISVDEYYPILDLFVPAGTPASAPGWWTNLVTIESDEVVWDERITGINIYHKVNDGEFYHLYKIDVTGYTSLADDSGGSRSWSAVTANYYKVIDIADFGKYGVDTYYSHSGFNDYIEYTLSGVGVVNESKSRFFVDNVMCNWNIGCMFRDMAVVAPTYVFDNGVAVIKPHKRINISMPGCPDVFHPDHWLQVGANDSTPFKCIQPLGIDRLVLFDANNTYIVNAASADPLGWYLENTYNVGIASGNAWTQISEGLAFANSKGIYVLDNYGRLTEISRKIRTSWSSATASGCHMHFDRKTNVLYIAKTGIANNYAGLQFDMENGAWSWWSDDASSGSNGNDIIQNCHGMFAGFDSETQLLWVDDSNNKVKTYTVKAPASPISIRQQYQSPHVDFGSAATVKTGKHLYIKYKSTVAVAVTIYLDGSSTGISMGTLAASTDLTTGHIRIPYRFRTLSVKVATNAYNSGVFEIDEIGIEFKQGRAK